MSWLRSKLGWVLAGLASIFGLRFLWYLHRKAVVDAEVRAELAEAQAEVVLWQDVKKRALATVQGDDKAIEEIDDRISRLRREAVEMVQNTKGMDDVQVLDAFDRLGY